MFGTLSRHNCVGVCLFMQDLLQNCSRWRRGIVEDMCYENSRDYEPRPVWTSLPITHSSDRGGKEMCERRGRRRGAREGACIRKAYKAVSQMFDGRVEDHHRSSLCLQQYRDSACVFERECCLLVLNSVTSTPHYYCSTYYKAVRVWESVISGGCWRFFDCVCVYYCRT
jgi:hypothetical protein